MALRLLGKFLAFTICHENITQLIRVPQKECGKRSSITFFRFWDAFGHFSVTFSDASVTFFVTFLPNSFCRTPFAAG